MRDCIPEEEDKFFDLFKEFFDTEKYVKKQHDPATYTLARMYPVAAAAGNPRARALQHSSQTHCCAAAA